MFALLLHTTTASSSSPSICAFSVNMKKRKHIYTRAQYSTILVIMFGKLVLRGLKPRYSDAIRKFNCKLTQQKHPRVPKGIEYN